MKVITQETLYMKNMVLLWSTSVEKGIVALPLFIYFLFFGPSFFLWPFFFFYWDNALLNDYHHTFIYLQLNDYNSILEQSMTLYGCLRRCTRICNKSRVTSMKKLWTVALRQILCQLHDHAKQYDNDECVMINWMVESCMAIYLGMAMEMP